MKSQLQVELLPIYAPACHMSPGQAIMAETWLNLPLSKYPETTAHETY